MCSDRRICYEVSPVRRNHHLVSRTGFDGYAATRVITNGFLRVDIA